MARNNPPLSQGCSRQRRRRASRGPTPLSHPRLVHSLNLRNMMQLLCPPKPNELDSATSMSTACLAAPTTTPRSTAGSGASRLRLGCTKPAGGGGRGRQAAGWVGRPAAGRHACGAVVNHQDPHLAPTHPPHPLPPAAQRTGADGLDGGHRLDRASGAQQVPNHALGRVDLERLVGQRRGDGAVLGHVACRGGRRVSVDVAHLWGAAGRQGGDREREQRGGRAGGAVNLRLEGHQRSQLRFEGQ